MSLTRADLIADVCIFGGALVLAASAIVRPARTTYRRAVHRNIGKTLLGGAVVLVSMSDAVQVLIDRMSGVPNLGMLVRLVILPVVNYRGLVLQDALVGADRGRRRWHLVFAVTAVAVTIVCWQFGAPHNNVLPTIPVVVPLDGATGWLYALAWIFCLELIVQCGSATRTAYRVLLHVYATGYERTTCLSTLLFGLAQACFLAVGVGLLLYPPGQATGHLAWIDLSTVTTEVFGVIGAALCLLAYAAPLWGAWAWGRQPTNRHGWVEDLLGFLLLLSSYGPIRRLAFHLRDVVPTPYLSLNSADTHLWRVRRVSDLHLLLHLFKTAINDARLMLLPYANPTTSGPADPARTARALADALDNYRQGRQPMQIDACETPLRDARLFNDERFLTALWHAFKGLE